LQLNLPNVNKTNSNTAMDPIKARSADSRKLKVRNKNRMIGGQNKQGHS